MSVTPEVSQLEISASKSFKPKKSQLMSEMSETLQSAMGPYVAIAEGALVSNFLAAAFKRTALVKAKGGEFGGGGFSGGDGGSGGGMGGDGGNVGGGGNIGGEGGVNMQMHVLDEEHGPELPPPHTQSEEEE